MADSQTASRISDWSLLFVVTILIHAEKDLHLAKDNQKGWNDETCALIQETCTSVTFLKSIK